jgi:hypothetical protein
MLRRAHSSHGSRTSAPRSIGQHQLWRLVNAYDGQRGERWLAARFGLNPSHQPRSKRIRLRQCPCAEPAFNSHRELRHIPASVYLPRGAPSIGSRKGLPRS